MYIYAYKTSDGISTLKKYTKISDLTFSPSTDLVGASIPVSEFSLKLKTTDEINAGHYALLYDDLDTLWARYWVVYAEHIDLETVMIKAQSPIAVLDRVTLPAVNYVNETLTNVLNETMISKTGGAQPTPMAYTLDSSLESARVTGFCPEQTARERLTWVCFAVGAYVKAYFNTYIDIVAVDNTETFIPASDTYYKPTTTFNDWVTAVRAKAYTFTPGTPERTDDYVTDASGNVYIMTSTTVSLTNSDAPSDAPEKVVDVGDVYLVNSDNVSSILSRLALWYFKRIEIAVNVIDNASYLPGDKVAVCVGDANIYSGYITDVDFEFGTQAKGKLRMTAAEGKESANLTVIYKDDGAVLGKKQYLFPVGYTYTIINPYLDIVSGAHRYVYRPLAQSATGTMTSGENTSTQECDVALDLHQNILYIISVDGFTSEADSDNKTIGVIA